MATNFYFNNFGASQEQTLIEDLIIDVKDYGRNYKVLFIVTSLAIFFKTLLLLSSLLEQTTFISI